jgi:putative membrane protein
MRSGLVFSSLTAITLAFASPAFAQQSPTAMPSTERMPQARTPAPGQTAASGQAQKKLSEKDKNFAKEAAMGGMAEVELGKMAQQYTQSDDVK